MSANQGDPLARIADALERISPPPAPVDWMAHPAYVWDGRGALAIPALAAPALPLLRGVDRQKQQVVDNVQRLAAGHAAHDMLLELQSNAVNTLANNQIPGTNPWIAVVDWLKNFIDKITDDYDTAFLDCNPSFSLYTQIALATSDRIVLPVMADDSSRRAIQNAFSLIYGLKLPSEIYAAYAFATKLKNADRPLPKVHLIAKNRLTQYMGAASAYAAVLHAIDIDINTLLKSNPNIFSFKTAKDGFVEIRDFQTTGVVAFAKGLPFSKVQVGKQTVNGHRVQVKAEYLENSKTAIGLLVTHL